MADSVKLRNVALVGHGGCGKTSLAEVMLFNTGATNRIGRIEDGNTMLDFEPEEIRRQTTISSGIHQLMWNKASITLIDTPGDQNFFSETRLCMQAADGFLVVVDAVDGIKVQTEKAWEFAAEFGRPCLIVINKLDRERASFQRALEDIEKTIDLKPVVLQLPIGKEAGFKGVVDLLRLKAFVYDKDGKGKTAEIPAEMQDQVESAREELIENIAEADDELLERYLEGETLDTEVLKAALRKGTFERQFVPVLCTAATVNIGIDLLMSSVVDCCPNRRICRRCRPWGQTAKHRSSARPILKNLLRPLSSKPSPTHMPDGSPSFEWCRVNWVVTAPFYNINKDVKERYNQLLTMMRQGTKAARQRRGRHDRGCRQAQGDRYRRHALR